MNGYGKKCDQICTCLNDGIYSRYNGGQYGRPSVLFFFLFICLNGSVIIIIRQQNVFCFSLAAKKKLKDKMNDIGLGGSLLF